ncbi:hypothetical protein A2W54_03700 [Candidatus Giovannonibacteria bacterium RIFCSPHIGHO2_02_43_13]|uniref:ROK family protein n=1 Tax=Candidatus Giovannonibacteria bacterium RIFCSPHIGHO2_02_43_13 TaxID=1798330 RepID=A0A1F5WR86_9BACT|nr:MAG: hypothetical protein UW28_C0043G0003 [Parcubacteria group bacterium GW2011_GWA2_44_13]OGF74625.1 MAG: hypothetical protein A3E06_02800 [Candidatus Giovannonibacteria bacterium RIFCSPHIGHO2_12_FULL_44_42]OGF78182.1 MAG: hypothetical protein A2W54_03700 [Candidatus Giovannonibacteria bacterium RIFCSPHIGHO2_02_43_13]OGF89046.1 MAG: hypothetical protein A3I94_01840 [Candidatus Giovannonibacteria bacterium RIFCSPLOWO2_02_FULL_43_54]
MTLIRANKRIIGIDIGGSKIRAVLWDGKKVLSARQIKTPKNLNDFRKEIIKLTTWQPGCQVEKIGIGAAGIISGTKIVRSPNIKYLRNFDFAKLLSNRIAKLSVDNDARCFACAVCPKKGVCLAITLGTGIGRGLAKRGKVQKIKAFEYPESWEKEYQKMRGKPKAVMSADFADFLAENLMPVVKKYKVDSIVFGGGVTDRNGFLKEMRSAFSRLPARQVKKIEVSKLGKNAVAVGAALLK